MIKSYSSYFFIKRCNFIMERLKFNEYFNFYKNLEFFFLFFFKSKVFLKLYLYSTNFFKNFYFGPVLSLKKKNFLSIFFLFFDFRLKSIFLINLNFSFFLNFFLINRPFFLNKRKRANLYFLTYNVRFRRFSLNINSSILKKDRQCLILYFNVQKKIRVMKI